MPCFQRLLPWQVCVAQSGFRRAIQNLGWVGPFARFERRNDVVSQRPITAVGDWRRPVVLVAASHISDVQMYGCGNCA